MNKLNISAIMIAISFACSTVAIAESMSKDVYKTAKDRIEAEYKADKAKCDSLSGNAKDICMAEAKGKEKVAKAELEAQNKGTEKARQEVNIAKAEAAYAVAKEKCDDKSSNEKDACLKEAKATEARAKADAKAQMKTSKANK